MNTIQILIVAFFILTYAYLILKIWDDIRDARRERKAIRYEITAIDIVDFTSMPARAKNGRFLPKDKGGPVDVSDQLFPKRGKDGKFLPKTKRPLWNFIRFAYDNDLVEEHRKMHKETNYHCWNLNDDSNDIFPDRDAKGRFVKAMPKARVDNFKGL